ncbi:hypothetical protein DTO013E5_5564 [Penicillium roqueforti]|nr:hypothetical protein CBS147354_3136 [Penicillium roqueforti]KAI2740523.1 hypothetical protein DTO012A1_5438 [Penicillium roqueforti]KAI2773938.1 hypothetical protein DTO012A8_1760 [Penicillium roqueforti]KAI3062211.1 hypothetical protein CBS147339_9923 [Penicillium roqueforti]KAI3100571.1 hypothetical protein CBS147338_3416 [Penicillium roqueforti]
MASRSFFLIGDDPSTAQSIEVAQELDLNGLKSVVARSFHIIQPAGVSFHVSNNPISKIGEVLDSNEPIGIRIGNHGVREPSGPKGLPLVGSFYEIFPDHLGNHFRLFRKYGGLIKTTNMGKTNYLTDDPEIAAIVLNESLHFTKRITDDHPLRGVKDNIATFVSDTETETWRLTHKYLPTSMGPKAVRHYAPLMQETVRRSFAVFDTFSENMQSWNVYQYMTKLASETVGKVILGEEFGHLAEIDAPFHPIVMSILNMFALNKKVASRGSWYRNLPFGDPRKLRESHRLCYTLVEEIVAKIEKSDGAMQKMPMANAALNASSLVEYLINATDEKGETFPRSMIVPNISMLTSAGFATTASLLSWLIFCLTTYECNQDRLLQELVDMGVTPSTDWNVDLVNKLLFLDKFVKETLRLHNPAFQPARTTKTEVILPGGYRLEPDSVVVCALYDLHSNPEHWSDPTQFQPDRWDTDKVKSRHRAAFLPFAMGGRGCIGFNFALLEAKILFSELVYRYEFALDDEDKVQYDPEFQLVRPLNLYVSVKKRTSWPEGSLNEIGRL